jgi:hypothetical protein
LRQNIGLLFLTFGSVLLSIGVFRYHLTKLINFYEWKNVPWEVRLYFKLRGIKSRDNYFGWIVRAQKRDYCPSDEKGDLALAQRIYIDLPIIAIVFIVIGFILCLNYPALGRFLGSMIKTKWLLTIVGCSLTVLGVVLVRVGNRWLGHKEIWQAFMTRPGDASEEGLKTGGRKARWAIRFLKVSWWLLILGPMVQLIGAVMK